MSKLKALERLSVALREARVSAGLSQEALAELSIDATDFEHISRKMILAVEGGRRPPRRSEVAHYEQHCEVSHGALMVLFERWLNADLDGEEGIRPALSGVNIDVAISAVDSEAGVYRMRHRMSMYSSPTTNSSFNYAVCCTAAILDLVEKNAAQIAVSTQLTDDVDFDAFTRLIARESHITGTAQSGKARTRSQRPFEILSYDDAAELLEGSVPSAALQDIRILSADISGLSPPLAITYQQDAFLSPCIFYWYAEQRMLCEEIEIDLSGLDEATRASSRVIPFLPTGAGVRDDLHDEPRSGRHNLSVQSWIQPGHGFAVYWSPSEQHRGVTPLAE